MSEKDELKKRKLKKPKKSKPEEEYSGKRHIPRPRPHIRNRIDINSGSEVSPSSSPILSPNQEQAVPLSSERQEQQSPQQLEVEGVLQPITYLPTEKDAVLDKIDEITSHIFDSASLALMKRIIEDVESTLNLEDEQQFYETISKNTTLINGLIDKIVYHWYHQEDFYAGLTEFLQLMFPGKLYERALSNYEDLIYEAAYADEQAKLSLFGYGNIYKK